MSQNQPLTQDDLQKVTGYKLPKKQRDALSAMEIPFRVDRNGRPILTWAVFNSALLHGRAQNDENNGFNLEAI